MEEQKPPEENDEMINIYYRKIKDNKIKTVNNILYNNVQNETFKIFLYLEQKIKQFPKIFDQNLKSFYETINYLEKISIQNNCECSENTDDIPGWKCKDCSNSENSLYCSNCFLKFKDFHKGHKVYFLPYKGGMCDCGNINNVSNFCPDHKGPYTEEKQIDEFIEKSFSKGILIKLKLYFDDLFSQFSKYLILTEQCSFFCTEIISINILNEEERADIIILNDNFCIVFQNFLNFLYLISHKNIGMIYLISKYILKNHFNSENLEDIHKTNHSCIKIDNKKITILYEKKENNNDIFSLNNESNQEKHKCECSFLRLLLANWRNDVISVEGQNENFLFSLTHNIFLKYSFTVLFFYIYKDIILNENIQLISSKPKFITQESIELLDKQTNVIENAYRIFYEYSKGLINHPVAKDPNGGFYPFVIDKIVNKFREISYDCNFFTKPKIGKIIGNKTNFIKILIDVSCIMHNQLSFKSIFPHPVFQGKGISPELMKCEVMFIMLGGLIDILYDVEDHQKIKEIFDYFLKKILNQKDEGIKQLEENEFSFHLPLYRFFGIFLNIIILKKSLRNNKNIIDSIEYVKSKLFNSKEEMQKVIDIVFSDYLKFLGFISGIRNDYFNYYEGLINYNNIYFSDTRILNIDFSLLKYLFVMTEKKLNLDFILKSTKLENSYSLFCSLIKKEEKNNNLNDNQNNANNVIENNKNEIKDEDENNHVLHWTYILELIIIIMKNDFSNFWGLLFYYDIMLSLETKSDFFNEIKKNKNILSDLKNILKEKIINMIISHGNTFNFEELRGHMDEFFYEIFDKKELNDLLEELTISIIEKESKTLILKDSSLKYLDLNYFCSPFGKSRTQLYINEFKKDKFKLFNSYYFKPSIFVFDFYNKTYENVLLNLENIQFLTQILENIFNILNNKDNSQLLNKIKNLFLPVILNYLTIFGTINSKPFVKFKLDNHILIDKIYDVLNNALESNKNNSLYDKDLTENIINTMNHLNIYKKINENVGNDLNKLNDYDFNIENQYEGKENININNKSEEKKNIDKLKNIKNKFKNLMKNKRNNFIEKIKEEKEMKDIIEQEKNNKEDTEENKDNLVCFYCRNPINLKSLDEPYGKLGHITMDFFYKNCFISSVKSELNKINNKDTQEKNLIIINIEKDKEKDLSARIISCGHYFHLKCFNEGLISNVFKCPLCDNFGNILIPPLTNYYFEKLNLKSGEKLDNILSGKINDENFEISNEIEVYKKLVTSFIFVNILKNYNYEQNTVDYNILIDPLFSAYDSYLNFLGNLYFYEATTFHKQQQIDTIQNLILSLRYLIIIKILDKNQIINYIKNGIDVLIKGPNESDNIMEKYINMFYSKYIDKIIFSFMIILDYDEIQKLFKYIINWSLPYISFWLYLREIISQNSFYSLYTDLTKEKMNIYDFKLFLNSNNNNENDYLKLYLQKLLMIKVISQYNKKKEDDNQLIDIFNESSLEKLFNELNIENLYQSLPKNKNNEFSFINLFEKIDELIFLNNSHINKNMIILNNNNIIDLMIKNILNLKEEIYLMKSELFSQFILYKFELIELDDKIFDWIEKNLFKKCDYCYNFSRHSLICLVCGKKFCNDPHTCYYIIEHSLKCMGNSNIFIGNQDMSLSCLKPFYFKFDNEVRNIIGYKEFDYLYTDDSGSGPGKEISNKYKLNRKKLKLLLKNFICNDFR